MGTEIGWSGMAWLRPQLFSMLEKIGGYPFGLDNPLMKGFGRLKDIECRIFKKFLIRDIFFEDWIKRIKAEAKDNSNHYRWTVQFGLGTASSKGRRPGLELNGSFQKLSHAVPVDEANQVGYDRAIFENKDAGKRPHAQLSRHLGYFFHIQFGEFHPALVGVFQLVKDRIESLTGRAPRSPKIHDHRQLALQHHLIKVPLSIQLFAHRSLLLGLHNYLCNLNFTLSKYCCQAKNFSDIRFLRHIKALP
jgi:hypothetical protein